jgi:hypothetical protein
MTQIYNIYVVCNCYLYEEKYIEKLKKIAHKYEHNWLIFNTNSGFIKFNLLNQQSAPDIKIDAILLLKYGDMEVSFKFILNTQINFAGIPLIFAGETDNIAEYEHGFSIPVNYYKISDAHDILAPFNHLIHIYDNTTNILSANKREDSETINYEYCDGMVIMTKVVVKVFKRV